MSDLTFGGGNGFLIPNVFKIHVLQREKRKDDKLVVKNIGDGDLKFCLPLRWLDDEGNVVPLPYEFSVNGEIVGDRPLLIPPGKIVFEVEEKGALITDSPVAFGEPRPILDSELPAHTAHSNVIAD